MLPFHCQHSSGQILPPLHSTLLSLISFLFPYSCQVSICFLLTLLIFNLNSSVKTVQLLFGSPPYYLALSSSLFAAWEGGRSDSSTQGWVQLGLQAARVSRPGCCSRILQIKIMHLGLRLLSDSMLQDIIFIFLISQKGGAKEASFTRTQHLCVPLLPSSEPHFLPRQHSHPHSKKKKKAFWPH